jgi:hypothetical protein
LESNEYVIVFVTFIAINAVGLNEGLSIGVIGSALQFLLQYAAKANIVTQVVNTVVVCVVELGHSGVEKDSHPLSSLSYLTFLVCVCVCVCFFFCLSFFYEFRCFSIPMTVGGPTVPGASDAGCECDDPPPVPERHHSHPGGEDNNEEDEKGLCCYDDFADCHDGSNDDDDDGDDDDDDNDDDGIIAPSSTLADTNLSADGLLTLPCLSLPCCCI